MAFCSNLQVPSSPISLSLPSEPPDIENWFPSYKYESLNDSELKGCVFGETATFSLDGPSTVAKDSCRSQGEVGPDQVPNSVSSDSILSEPPHIGNWFSSYVYESPALCTVDEDCDKTKINEKKYEEYASVSEECETENEASIQEGRDLGNCNPPSASKNFGLDRPVDQKMLLEEDFENQLLDKISDASQSQPFSLSELPDLRNWFSSYVYDSPVLGDSDISVHEKVKTKEDDLLEEENSKEKPTELSAAVVEDYKQKTYLANKGNGMIRKGATTSATRCKVRGSEFPSSENNNSVHIAEANSLSTKSNARSIAKNHHRAKTESNDIGSSEAPSCKDDHDKENRSDGTPGDGFVTTRNNRRPAAETPRRRHLRGVLQECTRANKPTLSESSADETARRKTVLSERTNLEHHNNAVAAAFTGKWHCPQKNKPRIGPPLKQLRLEQWVQRM